MYIVFVCNCKWNLSFTQTCPTVCAAELLYACSKTGLARKRMLGTQTRAEHVRARCLPAEAGLEPTLGPLLLPMPTSTPSSHMAVVAVSFRPGPRSPTSHSPQFSRFVCGFARTSSSSSSHVCVDVAVSCAVCYLHIFFFNVILFFCECEWVFFFKKQQQAFSTFTVIPNNVLPCR